MNHNNTVTEHFLATSPIHLEDVLEYIDLLHSAASDGESRNLTGMSDLEVVSLLRDMIYTAQETIIEIEAQRVQQQFARTTSPVLHIIPKIDKAG